MPTTSVDQSASATSQGQFDAFLQRFADGFVQAYRAPILHSPSEEGLAYRDVTFPSSMARPLRAGSFLSKVPAN
jgi:hypothetical protein